jgi:two-component system, sensor histidine kinase
MTPPEPGSDELRVLLVAPTGADGRLSQRILADAGMTCTVYTDVATVCAALPNGAGAVILTEEALADDNLHRLSVALTMQPPWSDVPIIVLTHAGSASNVAKYALDTLGNVMVLDRPVRVATLVSAVRTALRGRERQYQIRAHLQEREQLYAAERQARAVAEAAVTLRDEFLSIAAHELKTPLTSLLGNVQLVERRIARTGGLSERDQHAIHVASQQAGRLRQMIDALLDVSRLEQGQLSIIHEPIDVGLLVERVVQEVQPGLQQHTVASHIPAEAVVILGDELRLEQVLQNLIQNAIKYSPAGGSIAVTVVHDTTHAAVQVRDHGVGIPADALPHLFERFYRVSDAVERHIQGAGIGLFVVKEIVALHGGRVEVTSQEGVGSTFTVWLPLCESSDVQAIHLNELAIGAERHDSPTIVSTPRDVGASSILVVDDDPAIRAMLSEVLGDEGYNIVSAANGQEALNHLHHNGGLPQLILLDLMMPTMNGWVFLSHQQQDAKLAAIPVVVISAGANIQQRPLPYTPASILTKPVDVDLLLATVEHYCHTD